MSPRAAACPFVCPVDPRGTGTGRRYSLRFRCIRMHANACRCRCRKPSGDTLDEARQAPRSHHRSRRRGGRRHAPERDGRPGRDPQRPTPASTLPPRSRSPTATASPASSPPKASRPTPAPTAPGNCWSPPPPSGPRRPLPPHPRPPLQRPRLGVHGGRQRRQRRRHSHLSQDRHHPRTPPPVHRHPRHRRLRRRLLHPAPQYPRGVAPTTACTGTDQTSVAYSATYAFYKPAK